MKTRTLVVTFLRKKLNKNNFIIFDDDDEVPASIAPVQVRKKVRVRTQKRIFETSEDEARAPSPVQSQKKVRISSEDTHRQKNKPKNLPLSQRNPETITKKDSNDDTNIEFVENTQETPEKKLSMLIQ